MKFYAIRKADGGVVIMQTEGDPEQEIGKWHPQMQALLTEPLSIREIDPSDIPLDREFRDAWEDDGTSIAPNMTKARAIFDDRLNRARLAKAHEIRLREDLGENVANERAALQAMRPNSSNASTPAALKALWPQNLPRP